ncbi:MAG: hypothetical protein ACE5JB_06390 [bacterium]
MDKINILYFLEDRAQEKVRKLEESIKLTHPLRNRVVYAVPDPHIERWYIMDQRAFKNGIGSNWAPDLP